MPRYGESRGKESRSPIGKESKSTLTSATEAFDLSVHWGVTLCGCYGSEGDHDWAYARKILQPLHSC